MKKVRALLGQRLVSRPEIGLHKYLYLLYQRQVQSQEKI
jgi:hypothetical protein